MLQVDPGITGEQVERIIAAFRRDSDFADECRLATRNSLFDHHGHAPLDADAIVMETYADEYREDLAHNRIDRVRDDIGRRAASVGIAIERGTIGEKLVGRAILKEHIRACESAADVARRRVALLYPDVSNEPPLPVEVEPQFLRSQHQTSRHPPLVPVALTDGEVEDEMRSVITAAPTGMDNDAASERNPRLKKLLERVPPTRNLSPDTPWAEVWELYLYDRKKFDRIKERPAKLTSSLNLWQRVHGYGPASTWTEPQAGDLRRLFIELPAKYAHEAKWKKLGNLRIIAAAFQYEIEQASTEEDRQQLMAMGSKDKTWNRHNSTLRQFWPWAVRNGLVAKDAPNPFENLHIDLDEDAEPWEGGSQLRLMWEEAPLRQLLNSPLFLGCKAATDRTTPGTYLVRDVLYWGTLILAHTGMRREELCQLKRKHVGLDEETGIWYFDLKAKGLRLKEKASKRWVPISNSLLRLGIVEALLQGRGAEEMLFPELSMSGADGAFGTKFGKMFSYYRKTYDERLITNGVGENCVKVYRPLMDLHSFRTTVATNLIRLGVHQAHAEEVTGHKSEARRTAFVDYDRGATLTILKDALDRLVLPIDIEAMRRAASLV